MIVWNSIINGWYGNTGDARMFISEQSLENEDLAMECQTRILEIHPSILKEEIFRICLKKIEFISILGYNTSLIL